MKAFTDLAAALQIGVRRSPFVASGYLGEWHGVSGEQSALAEAGALDLMRRAGTCSRTSILPLLASPRQEQGIATKSEGVLMAAIDLGLRDVVLEWARAAAEKGLVAPPAALVKLIEWTPKHPRALGPILGARGQWLAAWMDVEIVAPEALPDPAELRDKLQSDWGDLDWKQRAEGIVKLRASLVPSDEALLTVALADRRKEVRESAAECLANLEESKFARELRAFAKGRLRVERKFLSKSLLVIAPSAERLPKELPRTVQPGSFGAKAHALYDLLRAIRPSFWEEETGLSPAELIELAKQTDYSGAVIAGWQDAASSVLWDQKWVDALFQHAIALNTRPMIRVLAPMASHSVYEAAFRTRLKANEYMPMRPNRFSPEFSKLVVDAVKQQSVVVDPEMSRCLDRSVLPLLRDPWDNSADAMRERWFRSLDLRTRLLDSLDP
ncbi:MAG: DUF5691 domain-containing protein [Fimbriimonas sp.]|nr:DUF5691 domain-containing protein [Fimbriimonas sp.]